MPPMLTQTHLKDKASSPVPAAQALKGAMNASRETYISNMETLREKGKSINAQLNAGKKDEERIMHPLEIFADAFIKFDSDGGPFDCYPDKERLLGTCDRIFGLYKSLYDKGFTMTATTSLFTTEFLTQSIFDWPAAQWGIMMGNVEKCAGNTRLDAVLPFYLQLVSESDGALDYTPALQACMSLPQNAKDVSGTPEPLPLLPASLGENPPLPILVEAALLSDFISSYSHYASIVCNGKPVKVEASADGGYSTDGVITELPASESSMGSLEKNEIRLFSGLNHECWHIRYNSFRFILELIDHDLLSQLGATVETRPGDQPDADGKVRNRIFITAAQGKPLAKPVEVENLMHFLAIFPENEQAIVKDLLNVVEDGRIEFFGLNYFSGIRAEYEQDIIDLTNRRPFIAEPKKGLEFGQIFEYIVQKTLAHTTRNELNGMAIPPDVEARAKNVAGLFLSIQQNGMRSEDSLNATMKAYLEMRELIAEFAKNSPKRYILKGWSKTPGKSGDKIMIISDPDEADKARGGRGLGSSGSGKNAGCAADSDSHTGGGITGNPKITDSGKKGESPTPTRTGIYPEWDVNLQAYWNMFATVKEFAPAGEPVAPSPLLVRQFEDQLLYLKPRGWVRLRHQRNGTFDILEFQKQYLDFKVSGKVMRGDYYTKMKKEERSVAVATLIDGSGSTGFVLPNGNTVLSEEINVGTAFGRALDQIGDANALYVFNSSGQADTNFFVCKDFDDENVRGMQVEPDNSNRDGAAIRHATKKLNERNEKQKILIYISDNQPADTNYGDQYAIADVAMAVREAEQAGITVFAISVSEYRDYLGQIYSANNYVCIQSAGEMNQHIGRIFRYLSGGQQ